MKQDADHPNLTGRSEMPTDDGGDDYRGIVNTNRPRMADVLAEMKTIDNKQGKRKPKRVRDSSEVPPNEDGLVTSSYLRLRVRLREGKFTVEEMWAVKGALTEPPVLFGPYFWEVRLDGRRIAMGDIADMGEERGSFDPKDPKRGHPVVKTSAAEIPIRIAGSWTTKKLTRAELLFSESKLRINLQCPAEQPLHLQWPRELRLIAHLRGLAPNRTRLKQPAKQSQEK